MKESPLLHIDSSFVKSTATQLEEVAPRSLLFCYICPTDESRMTTVPKPRSWEVKIYDKDC